MQSDRYDQEPYELGDSQRVRLVKLFTPVAIAFLVVYIVVAFRDTATVWYGYLLSFTLIAVLFNLFFLWGIKRANVAAHILVFLGMPVLLPWIVTGGPLGHGFYWGLVYIVWAFLLVGKRYSSIWIGLFFIGALLLITSGDNLGISVTVSAWEFIQFGFMATVTYVLLALYDRQSAFFETLALKAVDKLGHDNKPKS